MRHTGFAMIEFIITNKDGSEAVKQGSVHPAQFGPMNEAKKFASLREAMDWMHDEHFYPRGDWSVHEIGNLELFVHITAWTDCTGATIKRLSLGTAPTDHMPVCCGGAESGPGVDRLEKFLRTCPNAHFIVNDMTDLGREGSGQPK